MQLYALSGCRDNTSRVFIDFGLRDGQVPSTRQATISTSVLSVSHNKQDIWIWNQLKLVLLKANSFAPDKI